jgi:hypothetical protein
VQKYRSWPRRARIALLGSACLLVLGGCLPTEPGVERVPEALVLAADVSGYENIRFYSSDLDSLRDFALDRVAEIRRAHPGVDFRGRSVELNYLSLSGGGSDGAYGAGLLNGWTASGTRPKFDVVTGISTGSLIAPFAFLGPEYDPVLKEAYTTVTTADIADIHAVPALVGLTPSLSSNDRFKSLIARFLTPEVFAAIAREREKGRHLLIGTTNLDAQQAVIWDLTEIAKSGRPDSLDLARNIVMASASIPGLFPPVRIKVTVDGKVYDELHVDGGVTRQVFLFPPGSDPRIVDRALGWRAHRHAYVIRDGRISGEYDAVDDALLPVASRSITTLIKSQGLADLYRIALVCKTHDADFNLAYIPLGFKGSSKEMFDRAYMTSLYDFAFDEGANGYHWHKAPPGLEKQTKM